MNNQFETKFINGDRATVLTIYEKYGPKVIGHVINKGGTKGDGEEIFQITLLEVRKKILEGKYKSINKFGQYLVKTGMNTWSNELKRRKKEQHRSLNNRTYNISDDGDATLAEKIVKDKKLEALDNAMKMLDKPCKELIFEHYYNRKKLKEIAKEQEKKQGTIRAQLKRCRDRIKRWIG